MRRFVAPVLAGVAGLVALGAAACSAESDGATTSASAEPTVSPAVGTDESFKVLKDWVARHNRAITTGDEKLWRDTVTGSLEAPVSVRVRTYGKLPGSSKISLFNPVLYVPRQASYPKWFAAAALSGAAGRGHGGETQRSGGKDQQVLALFVRTSAKDDWRAAHWLTFKGKPPELAYDAQGYAIPAPDRGLPAAHGAFLASGDTSGFSPDAYSAKSRTPTYGNWQTPPGRYTPGPGPSYALRTKDGGSLVWYGLSQSQTFTGGTESTLPQELRNYLTKKKVDAGSTVQATWQWLAIGYAPVSGKGTVLGESVSLAAVG
ncbi:hypothetical protein J4573_14755 [Actinomadura barringtoniae]|uniref:DUF8094 domain-containing protein n=1 Tax=Actinomadura barringtoniae TaxID=1427535 RepID=A0A939P937_9ACTN|nr:hypothetical protein [Actinomadura barringtoniae]MBO2448362.1 hypothetical protein [Actinomadura barringtoniae]